MLKLLEQLGNPKNLKQLQTIAEKMTRLPVDNLLSGDSLTYKLDVSLVSDFLDSLTPENMDVASLGLADTDEDDLFGDLEVFELYGVNHTVSELKKKIKVKVKLTLPSTFVVEGAQTVEDEEYEETIKEVKELVMVMERRKHRQVQRNQRRSTNGSMS